MKKINRALLLKFSLFITLFVVLMVSPRDTSSQEISGKNNNVIINYNEAVINVYEEESISKIFSNSEIESLIICDNNVYTLNPDIKKMFNLRVLDLSKTNLDNLPQELSQLRQLQEIHLYYEIWQYKLDEVKRITRAKIVIE